MLSCYPMASCLVKTPIKRNMFVTSYADGLGSYKGLLLPLLKIETGRVESLNTWIVTLPSTRNRRIGLTGVNNPQSVNYSVRPCSHFKQYTYTTKIKCVYTFYIPKNIFIFILKTIKCFHTFDFVFTCCVMLKSISRNTYFQVSNKNRSYISNKNIHSYS